MIIGTRHLDTCTHEQGVDQATCPVHGWKRIPLCADFGSHTRDGIYIRYQESSLRIVLKVVSSGPKKGVGSWELYNPQRACITHI